MKPLSWRVSALVLATFAGPLQAGVLEITGDACADRLHVRADDVMLSTVLQGLADKVGFHLKFDPEVDRKVVIDREGSARDILKNLLGGTSLVIQENRSADCDDRYLVTGAWILPRGDAINYVDYIPPAPVESVAEPEVSGPDNVGTGPKGLRQLAANKEELRELRRKARRGELMAHPDTGEAITREEYDAIMAARPKEEE